MTTTTLSVTGMHCNSCSTLIDETLEDLDGVASAHTDLAAALTTVEFDPAEVSLETIAGEIVKLGYAATPA